MKTSYSNKTLVIAAIIYDHINLTKTNLNCRLVCTIMGLLFLCLAECERGVVILKWIRSFF